MKVSLAESKDILIPNRAVDKLLEIKDQVALRLYIYIAKNGGDFDAKVAANALSATADEIFAALDLLCIKGLAKKSDGKVLERADTIPEYTANDVSNTLETDTNFGALLDFTQNKLGKMLSTVDTQTLLGIYGWMGLPVEVICLIVTYCTEQIAKKYGEGRRPTMKNIENEARLWLNMGILTYEQAEDYLHTQEVRGTRIATIARNLHLSGRALSATENKYLTAWADAGYSDEIIMEAYDVTVLQTGKLNWRYMDKVLKNWETDGIKNKADMAQGKETTGGKMSQEQLEALRRAEELSKKWGSEE
ncbi:MAG: DnaD domain protein [Clostridia bacterium]|nr:DnaD domain protein [Clostridia bacterium]